MLVLVNIQNKNEKGTCQINVSQHWPCFGVNIKYFMKVAFLGKINLVKWHGKFKRKKVHINDAGTRFQLYDVQVRLVQ